MNERSLTTPTQDVAASDNLNTEAMVRGVLRALEHLGFAEPARRQPMVIKELEESASMPALPTLSSASRVTTTDSKALPPRVYAPSSGINKERG